LVNDKVSLAIGQQITQAFLPMQLPHNQSIEYFLNVHNQYTFYSNEHKPIIDYLKPIVDSYRKY
jgi:hypothetical protein